MPYPHEKVPVVIVDDYEDIATLVADRIANLIRTRRASGEKAVLGLATGSTPVGVYRELIRLHREEGLSFANVVTFNLDEYFPMEPGSIHSYHRFMRENLFDHIDIPAENVHIPSGSQARERVDAHAREFEAAIAAAGGIDFQILGIGKTGHIGFNEPGSGRTSRTRLVHLDTITRKDAAADFFGEENVPREAVTMGVGTIMEAREVALIATGEHKAPIVRRAVEGEVSHDVAATFLQEHPDATFYLDDAAAAQLTRVATPWLVREVTWTPQLTERAVLWLSERCGAPILKLDAAAYLENSLSPLLARYPSVDHLNREIFAHVTAKVAGQRAPAGAPQRHRLQPPSRRRRHLHGRHAPQAARERERRHRGLHDLRQHRRVRPRGAPVPGLRAAHGAGPGRRRGARRRARAGVRGLGGGGIRRQGAGGGGHPTGAGAEAGDPGGGGGERGGGAGHRPERLPLPEPALLPDGQGTQGPGDGGGRDPRPGALRRAPARGHLRGG